MPDEHATKITDAEAMEIADAIIRRVLNLDAYTSPEDDPNLLLVKRDTLHFIIRDELAGDE